MPSRTASENSSTVNVDAIFLCSAAGWEHGKGAMSGQILWFSVRLTSIDPTRIRAATLSCVMCGRLCTGSPAQSQRTALSSSAKGGTVSRSAAKLGQILLPHHYLLSIFWALSLWTFHSSTVLINRNYVVNPEESLSPKFYLLFPLKPPYKRQVLA